MRQDSVRKKTLFLPQDKLDTVKTFLKTSTEREAVVLSLDEVIWRKKLKEFLTRRPVKGFSLTSKDLNRMRRE